MVAGLDVLVLVAHAGNKDKEIRLGNDVRLLERLGDLLHACALGDGDDLGGTVTVDAQQVSTVDDQRTGQQDRHADDDDNHNEGADDPVLFPLFPGTLCRCTGIVIIMYRLRVKGFAFALQVGVQGIVLDGAPGCGFAAGEHFPLRTVKQGGLGVAVRLRLSVCRLKCLCCRLGCSRLALPGRSRFRCGTLCRLGCSRRRCRGRLPWCSASFCAAVSRRMSFSSLSRLKSLLSIPYLQRYFRSDTVQTLVCRFCWHAVRHKRGQRIADFSQKGICPQKAVIIAGTVAQSAAVLIESKSRHQAERRLSGIRKITGRVSSGSATPKLPETS